MAENIQRSSGRSKAYQLDKGGAPAESGPFIGEVTNNIDNTKSGRIQVWIEYLCGPNKEDPALWRTLSYVSPFYGTTEQSGTDQGDGKYVGNPHSYGMWMTPPDIGTKVICFFAAGDPNNGYYMGSVIEPGLNHMVPAIGASKNFVNDNNSQNTYFSNSTQLPVIEINADNEQIAENPKFFTQPKPVHSYVAGVLLQQGLVNDVVRGSIGTSSMRESPSSVYGVSSPGRPIYQGGLDDQTIRRQLELGQVRPQDVKVIGRRGGHSIVMDDGDLVGNDQLLRIRTSKGHQIIMSDSGNAFHFIHANGQTWIELGSEGTVDVYSSNSINLRSQGDINLHADRNINLNAKGGAVNIYGERAVQAESNLVQITAKKSMLVYSENYIGLKSDGTLSLKATKTGTWNGGQNMSLSAGCISLNSGQAPDVPKTSLLIKNKLPDVKFENNVGWIQQSSALETIVSRAPTHEPYPLHGRGVSASATLQTAAENVTLPTEINDRFESIQNFQVDTISVEQYEKQPPAVISLDSIEPEQVTGMLAQSSFITKQEYNEISDTKGVGKYGFDAQQLEAAGYLKPGTVEFFLSGGTTVNTSTVLASPSVWTGKSGAGSLASLLSDSKLQDLVQTELFSESLNTLKATGIVTGQEDPSKLAGLISVGSKYGPETVKTWIKGGTLTEEVTDNMNALARGSQFAVDLSIQKVNDALKGFTTVANNSTNTVSRGLINNAVEQIIGNPKVPAPNYTAPNAPNADNSTIET